MLNIIRKVFIVVVLLNILPKVANAIHGPMRFVVVIALLACGFRAVFSKENDGD